MSQLKGKIPTRLNQIQQQNSTMRNPTCKQSVKKAETICSSSFLKYTLFDFGIFRYDHLRDLLNKILSERPDNIIDFFEEYSRKLKEERYKPMTDHLRDMYVIPGRLELATQIMPMLKVKILSNYLIIIILHNFSVLLASSFINGMKCQNNNLKIVISNISRCISGLNDHLLAIISFLFIIIHDMKSLQITWMRLKIFKIFHCLTSVVL